MNCFDKSKYPCAICDQLGHTFENCLVLLAANLNEAYLRFLLLIKKFVKGLHHLDPTWKKHINNLNVLCDVTLDQLHALEVLEDSPIHMISSCVPSLDDWVDCVINMIKDDVTPLLTHHHSTIVTFHLFWILLPGVFLPIKMMMIQRVLPMQIWLVLLLSLLSISFKLTGKIWIFGRLDKENKYGLFNGLFSC